MRCETTKTSGTNARCDRSCSGVCNAGAIGCTNGWMAYPSAEGELQLIAFAQTPRSSGQRATVAPVATGAEREELANGQTVTVRCTDCMEGQGDDCHCREPADPRALRWMLVVSAVVWALIGFAVRSCA